MDYDKDKVDEVALALMYLVLRGDYGGVRAWKGFEWDTLCRLHEKGWIENPKGKAKSVPLTHEGLARCEQFFGKYFGKEDSGK